MVEKIDWKTTKETKYNSFVSAGTMPIDRAKVEALQKIAELLLDHNRLLEDNNQLLININEHLKELEYIREHIVRG